jgi:hypothetical protein
MTDKIELRNSVIDALSDQKGTKGNDYFSPDEIAKNVEDRSGQKPSLDDVNAILREQWGHGIEPGTLGAGYWKFGPGKPPRSQEIPAPGSRV